MQLINSDVANLSLAWIGASEGRILPSDALPREIFHILSRFKRTRDEHIATKFSLSIQIFSFSQARFAQLSFRYKDSLLKACDCLSIPI